MPAETEVLASPRAALLDALVEFFPRVIEDPPEPIDIGPKHRPGWFHASDLKRSPDGGSGFRFSPRHCVMQYLDLDSDCKPQFKPESILHMLEGTFWDAVLGRALELSGLPVETQVALRDPVMRLSSTADFVLRWGADTIVADLKSCGPMTFKKTWGAPEWDIHRAYWEWQAQAYMLLHETDLFLAVILDRSGAEWGRELVDCFAIRWVPRREDHIAVIQKDLAYMNAAVDAYLAAETDEQRAAALPSRIYR